MSLIACCYRDDPERACRLLAESADPNEREPQSGRTVLMLATIGPKLRHAGEIFALALSAGADVNLHDKYGWTALHFAAQRCDVSKAAALLENGAIVDVEDEHGNTPLSTATFESRGRGEMIQLLLNAGADPNRANKHGQTPVGLAKLIANYDVAQFFPDGS